MCVYLCGIPLYSSHSFINLFAHFSSHKCARRCAYIFIGILAVLFLVGGGGGGIVVNIKDSAMGT